MVAKKQLRNLMPKKAGGTRPKVISDDLLKKLKNIIMREKKTPDLKRKIGAMMSPGRVKAITGKNPGEIMGPKRKPKLSDFKDRRRKISGRMSMADMTRAAAGAAGKGSGKSLSRAGMAGMSKAVFNEAKRLKPSGRLSLTDMKRAKEMLKKRKGK